MLYKGGNECDLKDKIKSNEFLNDWKLDWKHASTLWQVEWSKNMWNMGLVKWEDLDAIGGLEEGWNETWEESGEKVKNDEGKNRAKIFNLHTHTDR